MTRAQKPNFRIFKTLELAQDYANRINNEEGRSKHAPLCVRSKAYLVAPKEFSAIELGFGYPTF